MTELESMTLKSLYSMREVIGMYCDQSKLCIDDEFNTKMHDVYAEMDDAINHMENVINERIDAEQSKTDYMAEQHRLRIKDVI